MKEAILLTDGYKLDHRRQYPEATEGAVVFGIQYFIKEYLMKQFQQDFFNKPKDIAVAEFKRRVDTFLGPNNVGTKHIEELHDLGYLPIRIKALPGGMAGVEAAIAGLEEYYNANAGLEEELIAATIPATEHSVMCAGGKEDELETFRRLILKILASDVDYINSYHTFHYLHLDRYKC